VRRLGAVITDHPGVVREDRRRVPEPHAREVDGAVAVRGIAAQFR
jgi:hypothetical protein